MVLFNFSKCHFKRSFWLAGFFFLLFTGDAQLTSFNFHHLTTANGLSNSTIRSIAQDKHGFIWIGTLNGLNVFNGSSVKSFYKSYKPGGLPGLAVTALCKDRQGTLWAGTRTSLCYYQYDSGNFIKCKSDSMAVYEITVADDRRLWIVTNKGVFIMDIQTKQLAALNHKEINKTRVTHVFQHKNGTAYFACTDGLRLLNQATGLYKEFFFPGISGDTVINSVVVEPTGAAWVSVGSENNHLIRLKADLKTMEVFDQIPPPANNSSRSYIAQILQDNKGKLWLTTSANGLVQFDPATKKYSFFTSNIALPNSIASDNVRCLFLDKEGGIWAGTEGYGVDWFYPEKNHFSTIQQTSTHEETLPGSWCRAATEDSAGNLWLGTGSGLSCYNLTSHKFTNYVNQPGKKNILYTNSIRSLLTDKKGFIWIGTSDGLNRYNPSTKQFQFLDEKSGIPKIFAWTLYLDKEGNVWAGGNSSVYRWNETKNTFENFVTDSLLGKFSKRVFRTIFQDSKGRFWFGLQGALLYDPKKRVVRHYMPEPGKNSIADENVLSITEDKEGIIWIGTTNGLSALDVEKNKFTNYTMESGLPSNEVFCLLIDFFGRLCMGTANGICFFDKRKNTFISFDSNDGLCSNQVNEQSAYRTANGSFVYPTYKGFVLFKPEEMRAEKSNLPVFISDFKVLGKQYNPEANAEELQQLKLHYNQNFFSIKVVSPYYQNGDHVWYAYKLEGFDKDWVYTKDPAVNYTNVPGGDYVFHYKASIDPNNWNVPGKTLSIHIGTVYHKTVFFWAAITFLSLTGLFFFYRIRRKKKEQLLQLESKAQRLEKEKALMQYESLRQQVNPHFLFNSLTSLRSLIRINTQQAAEFLDKMSLSYRYILKSSERELVPLSEELRFVRTYIDLQKTRFCDGLQVSIYVNEYHSQKKIAPVTIQNLIENAIKHNMIDEEQPLRIDVFTQNDYLFVQNNIQPKNFVETSNKHGLQHMQSMYKYLDQRPMEISRDDNCFTVKIPLI